MPRAAGLRCGGAPRRKLAALLACLLLALWAARSVPGAGAAEPATEYGVKAAFLYNFGKFVEWPPTPSVKPDSPFVIAVVGSDPFGPALDALAGKTIQGRKVSVRRFPGSSGLDGCDILFVSASERDRLPVLLSAAHKRNILTVGDTPRFARDGGVIEFVKIEEKVRFKINLTAAGKAGLRLSSQLVKLALRDEEAP